MPRLHSHFIDPLAPFTSDVAIGSVTIADAVPATLDAPAFSVLDSGNTASLGITIGATNIMDAGYLDPRDGLDIDLQVGSRSTANLRLVVKAKDYRPAVGEQVTITNNGFTIFAGTVDSIAESWTVEQDWAALFLDVQCVDNARSLSRLFVQLSYLQGSASLPAHAVVSSVLVANQISVQDVAGVYWDDFYYRTDVYRFDLMPLDQFFDKVAQSIGPNINWIYDHEKKVRFYDFDGTAPPPGPYDLTDSDLRFHRIDVNRNLREYANRVWMRSQFQFADSYSKTFTGDGTTTQFFLDHVPSSVLSITEDGVTKTVGRIVEDYLTGNTGFDWYHQPDQDSSVQTLPPRSPIPSGVSIVVTYKGPSSNLAFAEDTTAQAARAAVEGNSGIYGAVIEERNFVNAAAAQEYVDAVLTNMKQLPAEVRFETRWNGWRPGQKFTINITDLGINADFVTERVAIQIDNYEDDKPFRTVYTVQARNAGKPVPAVGQQFLERVVELLREGPDPATVAAASDPPVEAGGAWEAVFNVVEFDGVNPTVLSVGADKTVHRAVRLAGADSQVILEEVFALVDDAPTGAALTLNIRVFDSDGVDLGYLLVADLSITAGTTSAAETDVNNFAIDRLNQGDRLELDITQVGSTVTGSKLAVYVRGRAV